MADRHDTPPARDRVSFDWHCANGAHGGIYYAFLVREGIRIHVLAETVPGPADPCHPSACAHPGAQVVKVTATASAGDPTRTTIAEASASIHARLIRPAASAVPWHGDRGTATDVQAIANCAADQVTDAVADARLRLADLVSYAAGLGITATAPGKANTRDEWAGAHRNPMLDPTADCPLSEPGQHTQAPH